MLPHFNYSALLCCMYEKGTPFICTHYLHVTLDCQFSKTSTMHTMWLDVTDSNLFCLPMYFQNDAIRLCSLQ